MKTYGVYQAPVIKDSNNKLCPNGAKHWERIGTIESKNKRLALNWLKKNQAIESGFMFVLIQLKIEA